MKEQEVGGSWGEKKDNFLALLLNKSVSIATIQPAAREVARERERGEWGRITVTEGERRVTMATEEDGENELEKL